jgi:hypothetical protein
LVDRVFGGGPVLPTAYVGAFPWFELFVDVEKVADFGELVVRDVG